MEPTVIYRAARVTGTHNLLVALFEGNAVSTVPLRLVVVMGVHAGASWGEVKGSE